MLTVTSLSNVSQLCAADKKCVTVRTFLEKVLSPEHFLLYTQLLESNKEDIEFDALLGLLQIQKKHGVRRLKELFPHQQGWHETKKKTKGRDEACITLTHHTSQMFCVNSKTARGQEIAEFYVTVANVLTEYDKLQIYMETRLFKHNTLIEANAQWPVVYLADVFFLENDRLIMLKKIGWTNDIVNRHLRDMKATCIFTHAFRCIRAQPLEQEILRTPIVKSHLYKASINGHISSETMKFTDAFNEDDLVTLIKHNINTFNIRTEEADANIELERIRAQTELSRAQSAQETVALLGGIANGTVQVSYSDRTASQTGKPMGPQAICITTQGSPGIFYEEPKPRKNGAGYRIQRIDPAHPERPIQIYESPAEVLDKHPTVSRSRLKSAIEKHNIYQNYRWCSVPHDLDPNIVHNLPPTRNMRRVTSGMVAQLTRDGCTIKNVFRCQKDACDDAQLGPKSKGSMSNAVRHGSLCANHRYKLWDECDEALQTAFIATEGLPETLDNAGIRVSRMNNTGDVFEIYPNTEKVIKQFKMGRKTLNDAIRDKRPERGWYWKYTDPVKTDRKATSAPEDIIEAPMTTEPTEITS